MEKNKKLRSLKLSTTVQKRIDNIQFSKLKRQAQQQQNKQPMSTHI